MNLRGGDDPRDEISRRPSLRPSIKPSSGPPAAGASHNYRILVAALWVIAQLALVLTASRRVDGAFGFRTFGESSSIMLVLYREVEGTDGKRGRVHVDGGVWTARDRSGTGHRFTWYDRVPTPGAVFDQETISSSGAKAETTRLQRALDDLATHLPEDDETRRFLLDVTIRRNGREPVIHTLSSSERTVTLHPNGTTANEATKSDGSVNGGL